MYLLFEEELIERVIVFLSLEKVVVPVPTCCGSDSLVTLKVELGSRALSKVSETEAILDSATFWSLAGLERTKTGLPKVLSEPLVEGVVVLLVVLVGTVFVEFVVTLFVAVFESVVLAVALFTEFVRTVLFTAVFVVFVLPFILF